MDTIHYLVAAVTVAYPIYFVAYVTYHAINNARKQI